MHGERGMAVGGDMDLSRGMDIRIGIGMDEILTAAEACIYSSLLRFPGGRQGKYNRTSECDSI